MAKPRIRTDTLANLKPGKTKLWIPTGHRNLYLVINPLPTGTKSWYYRGLVNGRPLNLPIQLAGFNKSSDPSGCILRDEAEARADKIRDACAKGIDPKVQVPESETPAAKSLQHYWDLFVKLYLKNPDQTKARSPKYIKYQEWAWDKYCAEIKPEPGQPISAVERIGPMPIDHIDTGTMQRLFYPLSITPTTHNRLKAMLHKLYNWAHLNYPNIFKENPVVIEKAEEKDSRTRNLSVEELQRFGAAWRASGHVLKHNLMFSLLTGCRIGVPKNFNYAWVSNAHGDGNTLNIPPGTLNVKGTRFVIITEPAKACIKLLKPLDDREYYLMTTCLEQILRTAKIVEYEVDGEKFPLPCLHDLRRTFSSRALDIGIPDDQINAIIGHSTGTDVDGRARKGASRVSDTYLRRAIPPLIPSAEKIATYIQSKLDAVPAQPHKNEPQAKKPVRMGGRQVTATTVDLSTFLSNSNTDCVESGVDLER